MLREEVTATFFVTHHRAPGTTTTRLHRTIKDSDNKDESVLGATTKAFQNRDLFTEREYNDDSPRNYKKERGGKGMITVTWSLFTKLWKIKDRKM